MGAESRRSGWVRTGKGSGLGGASISTANILSPFQADLSQLLAQVQEHPNPGCRGFPYDNGMVARGDLLDCLPTTGCSSHYFRVVGEDWAMRSYG